MRTKGTMGEALVGGVYFFLVLTAGHALAQICLQPPAGLVSWWPGDENPNDIQSGNDGTLLNGATFAPGKVGQAFSFDGIDDIVSVADAANLHVQNAFTIDAWVNVAEQQISRFGTAIVERESSDTVGFSLRTNPSGTQYRCNIDNGPTDFDAFSTTQTSPGTFQHVACTFDGSTLRIYVNGVLEASTPAPIIADISEPLFIGESPTESIPFEGLIDEVEIFNRALADAEIQAIFNADSEGKCKVIIVDIKPGSFPNSINPRSKGVIPVAILTTDIFDASTVDPTTILFGASGREAAPLRAALEDVDRDGDLDMILHFKTQETGIVCGDASASLTGEAVSGRAFEGSDSIKTVGCK